MGSSRQTTASHYQLQGYRMLGSGFRYRRLGIWSGFMGGWLVGIQKGISSTVVLAIHSIHTEKQELYGAHTPCALQFIENSFIGYVTLGSFV